MIHDVEVITELRHTAQAQSSPQLMKARDLPRHPRISCSRTPLCRPMTSSHLFPSRSRPPASCRARSTGKIAIHHHLTIPTSTRLTSHPLITILTLFSSPRIFPSLLHLPQSNNCGLFKASSPLQLVPTKCRIAVPEGVSPCSNQPMYPAEL
jgi:hypothetical protein